MRRLLAGAVATEMLVGLAVAAVWAGDGGAGPGVDSSRSHRQAAMMTAGGETFEGPSEARATDPSRTRSAVRWRGTYADPPRTWATDHRFALASGAEHPDAAATKRISFEPPVDFATGADPSSAEFNRKAGEQTQLTLHHLALSDSVVTGDFNGDNHADVVQTNVLAGSLSIFLGDGRAGFAPPAVQRIGVNPNFAVAGDLDADGALDLAVADTAANGVTILRGDGQGGFETARFLAVPTPRNIAIGRLDRDPLADLVVASAGPVCARVVAACDDSPSEGGVHAFVGLGGGAFRPAAFLPVTHSTDSRPVGANFVALRDFNGDRLDDLAVTAGAAHVAFDRAKGKAKPSGDDLLVFLNGGGVAPFAASPSQPPVRVGGSPDAIAVGDWNGDAHADLATLETTSGSITSLLGSESGTFGLHSTTRSVGGSPRSLTVGDFDGDGVPDLVTAGFAVSTISVLRGRGDGAFLPAVDHWAGEAPTSATVGNFDGDRRLDIVVGRLRTDQMSLLINDGPRRGDGVVIHRDIPYGSPTDPDDDPFPTKHTLDVYVPSSGTAPFGGSRNAYPVVFFAHGGARLSNKSYASYLLRSLSAKGIVVVSTGYRLGFPQSPEQVQDVAQAFRWIRDNIGSAAYRGDPVNVVAFGHSFGGGLLNSLATDPQWADEQQHIRALALVSCGGVPGAAARIPESLHLSGDEGLENGGKGCDAYVAESRKRGTKSTHVNVAGRDHFTLLANLARPSDPGRIAIDAFLREQLDRDP